MIAMEAMMHHKSAVKAYDTMHIIEKKQKISRHDQMILPEVARNLVDAFEVGGDPAELGRGIGGAAVVYSVLRAAIRGLRSHNMLARPIFALDGYGKPITAIPAASERRLRERRLAA